MHRVRVAGLVAAAAVAVVVVTIVLVRLLHHSSPSVDAGPAADSSGSFTIVRHQRVGASQVTCQGDGAPGPIPRFTVPRPPSSYRATLTVSFRYRTAGSPGTTFGVRPLLAAPFRPYPPSEPALRPAERPLSPAGRQSRTATITSQVAPLFGGHEYRLAMQPFGAECHLDPRTGNLDGATLRLTDVTYTVRISPN